MKNKIKNIFLISLGLGLGPFIVLLSTPWIARLFTPQEYGFYSLIYYSGTVLSVFLGMRFDSLIQVVRWGSIRRITDISIFVVMLGLALCSFVILLFYCLFELIDSQYALNILDFGFLVLISAFLAGIANIFYAYLLRTKEFYKNIFLRISQPIAFLIGVALFNKITDGLVLSFLFSWLPILFLLIVTTLKKISSRRFLLVNLIKNTKKINKIPLSLTLTSGLDALVLSLPVFLISIAYGSHVTGLYAITVRTLMAPVLLLCAAIGQYVQLHSGELYRSKKSSLQFMMSIIRSLSILIFIWVCFLILFSKSILGKFLGVNWQTEQLFVVSVIISAVWRCLVSPISNMLISHRRVDLLSKWQIFYFLFSTAVLPLVAFNMGILTFLATLCIVELIAYTLYFFIIFSVVKNKFKIGC